MKKLKRVIALLLVVCMLAGTALNASAAQTTNAELSEQQSEQVSTTAVDEDFMRILHLDNGRKYFTKDWIIALINEMEAAGYNQLQLAFGNDGMRFLLDDMSVTVNGTTYSSQDVTAGIKQGNKNYYNAGDVNELTQTEMTAIVNYAKSKGIAVIPHMNMPGHMDAILDAIEYVGITDAHFTGDKTSVRSLNLNNDGAVAFTLALLEKYVAYFKELGCEYFHIGADEFGNDAYGENVMGFPNMGSALYTKFAKFVNDAAGIVKNAGMTPRAWNDGISYKEYSDSFDTAIQITYWSPGWWGYDVASASTLSGNGHPMINTNGDYYYVLKTDGTIQNPDSSALDFENTAFAGSTTISNPVGSMFCIWCDDPDLATEQEIAEDVRITLRKMAAAMQDSTSYSEEVVAYGFNEDGTINDGTVEDENTGTDDDTTELLTKTIELVVGESKKVSDSTGNYKPTYTGEGLNTNIANVEVDGVEGVTETTVSTSKATTIEDGATYVIRVFDTNYALSSNKGRTDWGTSTLAFEYNALTAESEHLWTLKASNSGYKVKNKNGYLNLGDINNQAYLDDTGEDFTITNTSIGWTIGNEYGRYINALGGLTTYYSAGGWTGDGTRFDLYKVTEETEASTDITFTGVTPGTTYVTVGNTKYTIIVSKKTVNDVITVDAYKTYADNSTNVNVSDATIATAKLENGTLTITGIAEGSTVITTDNAVYNITVTALDLSTVDPLTIEYWITNGRVTNSDTGLNYIEISASQTGIYSETGVALTEFLPSHLKREGRNTEYWQSKLLDVTKANDSSSGTQEQTLYVGDDETLNDTTFTHVRYWNNEWQVLVDTTWTTVNRTEVTVNNYSNENLIGQTKRETHQLVAYYMEIIDIQNANGTTELHVNAADWGFKSGENWGYGTGDYTPCTVTVQIVYEDGTTNPNYELDNLLSKTLVYGYWEEGRGLGTMIFDGGDSYDIYKVTAETGNATYTNNYNGFTINSLTWDENEETVWAAEPTQSVSIGNPARTPSYEDPKDNLAWNTKAYNTNNAILVRVYVKAVETEDTLTVVYYDEKFGDTLYEYNINVASGVNFNDNILNLATGNVQDPNAFVSNAERIDVTGYGIKNALDVTQKFQTDLTLVPEAVGKYNSGLYTYTGSVISADGKTLYLYYNIDTEVLSPMFVADFGNPFSFDLSQVVGDGQETLVENVTVEKNTRYGTLDYDSSTKEFIYTPTQVLPNIDVLTINIKFDGATTFTTTNAGVMPATTVDYEEGFATLTGFTGGSKGTTMQNAWVAGDNPEDDVYGYDSKVVNEANTKAISTAKGNTAVFSFTGTGVDLYINSTGDSGNIAVQVRNAENKLVKVLSIQTTSYSTITDNFSETEQRGLIAGSVQGLAYGQYTVKVTTTNDAEVYFDGFRVYGTLQDQANDYYKADLEDEPMFLELRDYVLSAANITVDNSIYKNVLENANAVYEQILNSVNVGEGSTLTSVVLSNENLGYTAQELLDNGPKNELFLLPGQSVVFNVNTNREVQVGLKAVNGTANVTGAINETIATERDMFYTVKEKTETVVDRSITITNEDTSKSILSITKVKICDDPNAIFGELEAEDLVEALETLGFKSETPEPTPVYVDAKLSLALVDYNGNTISNLALTSNGEEGKEAIFTAEEIKEAVLSAIPDNYAVVDINAIVDQIIVYGESADIEIQVGKVATLTVTYVKEVKNNKGNKKDKKNNKKEEVIGTATLTAVQTSKSNSYTFTVSEIKAAAPDGFKADKVSNVKVKFGETKSLKVKSK